VVDSSSRNLINDLFLHLAVEIRRQCAKTINLSLVNDPSVFQVLSNQFHTLEILNSPDYHAPLLDDKGRKSSETMYLILTSQVSGVNSQFSGTKKDRELILTPALLKKVTEKFVEVFKFFKTTLETLVSEVELNPQELRKTLENFSQSDGLQNKISSFDSVITELSPVLKQFRTECCSFEVIKEGIVKSMFKKLQNTVNKKFLDNFELQGPNSEERDVFYCDLHRAYSNLVKSSHLQSYLATSPVDQQQSCDAHIKSELTKIKVLLIDEILKSDRGLDDNNCDLFSIWYDNLRAFKSAFHKVHELSVFAQTTMREVDSSFIGYIKVIKDKIAGESDDKVMLQLLFKLKEISDKIVAKKPEIDGEIDKVLDSFNDISSDTGDGGYRLINIGVLLNKPTNDARTNSLAQKLLSDHKSFEGNQMYVINEKFKRMAVEKLIANPNFRGTDINQQCLSKQAELFELEYVDALNKGLEDLEEVKTHTYKYVIFSIAILSFFPPLLKLNNENC
jgi:hypothetical protein